MAKRASGSLSGLPLGVRKPKVIKRKCKQCELLRDERFFHTTRSQTCDTCQRKNRRKTARNQHLIKTYEITHDEYQELLAFQEGKCAICKGRRLANLDVDHDHRLLASGEPVPMRETVRGLLCKRCNRRLLPAALDRVEFLLNAIAYLQDPPARKVLKGKAK